MYSQHMPRSIRAMNRCLAASAVAVLLLGCEQVVVVHAVSVQPAQPQTSTQVSCVLEAGATSDTLALVPVDWFVDGVLVRDVHRHELSGQHFRKGQSVSCAAGAGQDRVESVPITPVNTPPLFDDAVLQLHPPPPLEVEREGAASGSPAPPWVPESIRIQTYGFFDVDGDPEGWRISWTVDEVEVGSERELLLAPLLTDRTAELTVAMTVAPWDGEATGRALRRELALLPPQP